MQVSQLANHQVRCPDEWFWLQGHPQNLCPMGDGLCHKVPAREAPWKTGQDGNTEDPTALITTLLSPSGKGGRLQSLLRMQTRRLLPLLPERVSFGVDTSGYQDISERS